MACEVTRRKGTMLARRRGATVRLSPMIGEARDTLAALVTSR